MPPNKEIFWEPIFLLMEYGHFSYTEAYKLPINARRWFLDRIAKERKKQNSDENNPEDNDSENSDKKPKNNPIYENMKQINF